MGKSHLALIFHVYCVSVFQFSYLLASIALLGGWGSIFLSIILLLKAQLPALPGKNETSDFWDSSTFPSVARATHALRCAWLAFPCLLSFYQGMFHRFPKLFVAFSCLEKSPLFSFLS